MKKFECNNCINRECIAYYSIYNSVNRPSRCTAGSAYITNWHEVKEDSEENVQTAVNSEQLQKLTVDVFNRTDCPKWANYAYVDGLGNCILLRHKPCSDIDRCLPIIDDQNKRMMYGWGRFCQLKGNYIERPAKALPNWVKVGAVGYDDMNNEYFEVIEVNNDSFRAKSIGSPDSCSGLYFNEFCSEGNKRPFNEKEMRELVGKVLETSNVALLVDAYMKVTKNIVTSCGTYNAEELRARFTVDGKPCYKLEHLNEKGEWVE